MPKDIAIISYNLDPGSSLTSDAVIIRDTLNAAGYSAVLVHQWSLKETDAANFKSADEWEKYDGVVICNFYGFWNLRELIRSGRPVICANVGYADDLGMGEQVVEHISEDDFTVINNTHPIVTGLPLGSIDVGSPVWLDSLSTFNHHVNNLITTLSNKPVLAAHKTKPIVYFGWYRMSQASAGSQLFDILRRCANWVFSGP